MKYSNKFPAHRAAVALLAGCTGLGSVAGWDSACAEPLTVAISARVDASYHGEVPPLSPLIDELPLTVWDLESAGEVQLAVFDFRFNPRAASLAGAIRLHTGMGAPEPAQPDGAPVVTRLELALPS
ncbi:MAG: hypothetical protein ACFUZC_20050 [Chthoniobacteraceae bacterium]